MGHVCFKGTRNHPPERPGCLGWAAPVQEDLGGPRRGGVTTLALRPHQTQVTYDFPLGVVIWKQ